MKPIIVCAFVFSMSFPAYCQDIKMSPFLEKLVSLYVAENSESLPDRHIILQSSEDSTHYYMWIYDYTFQSHDGNAFPMEFGRGIRLLFAGTEIPCLFTGQPAESIPEPDHPFVNYDPYTLQIAMHKDGSLCKMMTWKDTPGENIDDIIALAVEESVVCNVKDVDLARTYSNIEVDHPAEFPLGNNKLYDIISSAITVERDVRESVPVIILLTIDGDGEAAISGFIKESADTVLNAECMKAAELVTGYRFKAASHRGERIKVYYPLSFVKSFFNGGYTNKKEIQ